VARTLLESYPIKCVVNDELTVQVHNFYSNAIGGIALSVTKMTSPQAERLLEEHGFEEYISLKTEASFSPEIECSESRKYKLLRLAIKIGVAAAILVVIAVLIVAVFTK
jgi:hypothetical protein